jgi:hypothetical protein
VDDAAFDMELLLSRAWSDAALWAHAGGGAAVVSGAAGPDRSMGSAVRVRVVKEVGVLELSRIVHTST